MSNHIEIDGVLYLRNSDPRQNQGDQASLEQQREWAYPAAMANGVRIVREFQDDGIAGDALDQRPGLQKMLAFCAERADSDPIQVVVNWNGDRFSRAISFKTSSVLSDLMDAGTTRMLTPAGMIDFENAADRLVWNIGQDFTRSAYAKSVAANVTRKTRLRALAGEWCGSTPPLGYIVGPNRHLALGEDAAVAVVQRIFARYDVKGSPRTIAADLNADGFHTAEGNLWTAAAVLRILENRRYLGEARWGEESRAKYSRATAKSVIDAPSYAVRDGARRRRMKQTGKPIKHFKAVVSAPEDVIVVPGAHPPIIDVKLFDDCAARRAKKVKDKTPARRISSVWPLSGLLFCGSCGEVLHGVPITKKGAGGKVYRYSQYVCKAAKDRGRSAGCKYIGVDSSDILRSIIDNLKSSLASPEALAALDAEVRRQSELRSGEAGQAREQVQTRLAEVERKISASVKNLAFVEDLAGLPADHVRRMVEEVAKLHAERDQLTRDLATVEQKEESRTPAERARETIEILRQLRSLVRHADPQVVRAALEDLVARVDVVWATPANGVKRGRHENPVDHLEIELTRGLQQMLGLSGPLEVCGSVGNPRAGRRR